MNTQASLLDDLRAALAALNDLHHPVYPADPKRITELEARVERIRADLAALRTTQRQPAA